MHDPACCEHLALWLGMRANIARPNAQTPKRASTCSISVSASFTIRILVVDVDREGVRPVD